MNCLVYSLCVLFIFSVLPRSMGGRFRYLLVNSINAPTPKSMYRSLHSKGLEKNRLPEKQPNSTHNKYKSKHFKRSDYMDTLYRNYTEMARFGDASQVQQQYGNAYRI